MCAIPWLTHQDPPFRAVRVGTLRVAAAAGVSLPRDPRWLFLGHCSAGVSRPGRGWGADRFSQGYWAGAGPGVPSTVRAPPRPPIPSCDRAELGLTAPGRAGAGSGAAARKPPSSDGRLQPPPCCRLAPASTSATSKKGASRRHRGSALADLLATPLGRGGPQSGKV